ncbi:hypothetical protein EMCRGX_G008780 [Ephydatia muelleri]
MANPKCNCCDYNYWPASSQNTHVCRECVLWSTRNPNPNIYPIDDEAEWSIGCDCCNLVCRQSYYGIRGVRQKEKSLLASWLLWMLDYSQPFTHSNYSASVA